MTKNHCPMCGKPNPEDSEVCQFCEARLKPLVASSSEEKDSSSLTPEQIPSQKDSDEQERTLPALLQDARNETSNEEVSPSTYNESAEKGAVEDWLLKLQDNLNTEDDAPSPSTEEDDQDWLQRIRALEAKDKASEKSPHSKKEDLPQWLSEIEAEEKEPEVTKDSLAADLMTKEMKITFGENAQEDTLGQAEMPDWLKGEIEDDALEEKLPDWLSMMNAKEAEEKEPEASEDSLDADLIPKEMKAPFREDTQEEVLDQAGMPDWLKEEIKDDAPEAEQEPEWLPSGETETPLEKKVNVFSQPITMDDEMEDPEEDIFAGDLPKWLTEATSEELAEEGLSEDALAEIMPSELPGWVEAMRPVKTPSQNDLEPLGGEEEYIENSGPLAGMSNILPVEAAINKAQKASKHPFKLKVTKDQQHLIALLESIISNEKRTVEKQTTPFISTQRVLRWIVGLVLFFSIGISSLYKGTLFSYPLHKKEILSLIESIQALPKEAPVLIAFDYEPALSGEMNAITASIVDHLMLQGAYLTIISTSPTGPVLAENFLSTTQTSHYYVHGQQYVNLGYIPGGAAGLLSFVIAPQNITPLAFNGADPWTMQPLRGIESISDFSLVLVITDDPDNARTWVEQVQPYLAGTPLTMAVSAQAEPLVRPYYEVTPRQIAGLVAGLPGGVSYEQLTGHGNLGQEYWNAFNIGVIVTLLMLFISGIVNVGKILVSKGKENEKKESA